jgi:hypothetical protein
VREERHAEVAHPSVERIAARIRGIDPHRVRDPFHDPRAGRRAALELGEGVLPVRMDGDDRDERLRVLAREAQHEIVRDIGRRPVAVDAPVLAVAVVEREDSDPSARDRAQAIGELRRAAIDVLDAPRAQVDLVLQAPPGVEEGAHPRVELAPAAVELRARDVGVHVEELREVEPVERAMDEIARGRARLSLEILRRAGRIPDHDRAEHEPRPEERERRESEGRGRDPDPLQRGVSASTVPLR